MSFRFVVQRSVRLIKPVHNVNSISKKLGRVTISYGGHTNLVLRNFTSASPTLKNVKNLIIRSIPIALFQKKYWRWDWWNSRNSYSNWKILGAFGICGLLSGLGSVSNDVRVDEKEKNVLFKAAKEGRDDELRAILTKSNVNCRHKYGWTPLMVAAANGRNSSVKILLENGADPDLGDDYSNAYEMAETLRAHSLDVQLTREDEFCDRLNNRINFRGTTALHYACLVNDKESIVELLKYGANRNLANANGHVPSQYATKSGQEILRTFVDAKSIERAEQSQLEKKRKEAAMRRKFPFEQHAMKHVIGQEAAIAAVGAAIRRKQAGWTDDEHPLVFIFLGSSGIGKTELAKQIARYMHGDNENAFIRIDMSEYMEKHEVSKFIGSPPGYIGHEQGGQLTKKLAKFKNAVVLFDEIEKAHPDMIPILLQLFDEGRITDGQGKTITCKDAVFVMTSNLASDQIAEHALQLRKEAEARLNDTSEEQKGTEMFRLGQDVSTRFKENVVRKILKRHFQRDEFLGRINEFVYFVPFTKPELRQLALKELEFWKEKSKSKHGIELTWEDGVLDAISSGYNVYYGARSIKHGVETMLLGPLAKLYDEIIDVNPNPKIHITVKEAKTSTDEIVYSLNFIVSENTQSGNKIMNAIGSLFG